MSSNFIKNFQVKELPANMIRIVIDHNDRLNIFVCAYIWSPSGKFALYPWKMSCSNSGASHWLPALSPLFRTWLKYRCPRSWTSWWLAERTSASALSPWHPIPQQFFQWPRNKTWFLKNNLWSIFRSPSNARCSFNLAAQFWEDQIFALRLIVRPKHICMSTARV